MTWNIGVLPFMLSSRLGVPLGKGTTVKLSKKTVVKIAFAAFMTVTSIYIFAPWEFGLYYLKPLPTSVQQEADNATRNGIDGILIYIDQKGQEPQALASGWHNRDNKIPAYPKALFKIASIAKLYVASAVTKLVGEGKLSLDKTLAHYMPELDGRIEYADQITLRMLVQHRSGIPNFTDDEQFDWGENGLDVLSFVLDDPADFEPDTNYAYSNTNYLLLDRIMDRVLGYPNWRYITEKFLVPLGLNNTFASIHAINPDDLMSGYYVGNETDFKYLDQGFVATARDTGVFLRALNEGTFFTKEEREIYASIYHYEHTGWVLGYTSIARYHPDLDAVVIQFINTTGNDMVLLNQIVYGRVVDILRRQQGS